jgi:hypothetical protein
MQQQQQQPAPVPRQQQQQPSTPPPATQPQPAQPQFNPQQVTPVVQIDAPKRADEVGVEDVLIGSIAMIGVLIVAALLVGLITGGIFIAIQRWRDKNAPDTPAEPSATRLNLS